MTDKTVRFPYRPRPPAASAERWISPFCWFLVGVFAAMAWGLWLS